MASGCIDGGRYGPQSSFIKCLPKTELHIHLDGSLSPSFIARRARVRSVELPETPIREHLHEIKAQQRRQNPHNPQSKGGNWSSFDFCNQFLQSTSELQEAAYEVCKRCASEGTRLVELRFCPTLHTLEGMSPSDAVEAVVKGLRAFEKDFQQTNPHDELGFRGGVILCALRSHDVPHSLDIARLCVAYKGRGVVGFDVAGDEGNYPLSLHQSAVEYCKEHGVNVTVHAGEWPNTHENVRLALDLGVDRIGHGGLGLASHPELLSRAAKEGTTVEVCITANVRPGVAGGWVQSYESHPVRTMFDAGIRVALSCDNLLLSGDKEREASPANELYRLITLCGFCWNDAATMLVNGARGSFVFDSESERREYVLEFEKRVQETLSSIRTSA